MAEICPAPYVPIVNADKQLPICIECKPAEWNATHLVAFGNRVINISQNSAEMGK